MISNPLALKGFLFSYSELVLFELIVLAGQDGVEQDAHDGGDSQTRQGHDADLDAAGVGCLFIHI